MWDFKFNFNINLDSSPSLLYSNFDTKNIGIYELFYASWNRIQSVLCFLIVQITQQWRKWMVMIEFKKYNFWLLASLIDIKSGYLVVKIIEDFSG